MSHHPFINIACTDTQRQERPGRFPRRTFLSNSLSLTAAAATAGSLCGVMSSLKAKAENENAEPGPEPAQIAITLDLEMSREYPRRGMTEWDFQKGNLDEATKAYAVRAAKIAKDLGGRIHFFCVGRVLEQENIDWLKQLAADGHPIGNHTYDHVNVLATDAAETQFRFRRAPWLVRGMTARQVIEENIRLTQLGLKQRAGIDEAGFRTPGGFADGLAEREDIQQMLLGLGYRWVSSKYPPHQSGKPMQPPDEPVYKDIVRAVGEAQPFVYPSGLIEIPMSPISDVTAFRSHYWKLDYFLRAIGDAVDWAIETGGVFDFLAHPSCLVIEDPECRTIRLICERVRAAGERATIVGLDQIADRLRT